MFVLIPMDGTNLEEAKLTKLNDVKIWTQVLIEEGEVQGTWHSQERDGFENFSDTVIVCDEGEYIWPFMEQNMMVLVAHTQRYLEDILEAFLFKELNEIAY